MYRSVYDLKSFYNSKIGRVARRVLQARIRSFWPETHGLSVMGCGYATPYLRSFIEESERVFSIMPASQGAYHWPQGEKNLTCLSQDIELSLETNSVDRMLLVHSLEFSEHPQLSLQEIFRVLKAGGRLLMIVPARGGLWSRADWLPFGQGSPYSAAEVVCYLRDNMFVHESTEGALYMPPLRHSFLLKSAGVFETLGRAVMPFGAGVHMVEATKQLYAHSGSDSGSKVTVRGRVMVPRPVPQGLGRKAY